VSTLIIAVFVTSLVGSLHCAGMCGGVVALCVGVEGSAGRPWLSHAAYHLGRLATYAGLGVASGAVGAAIDLSGGAVGLPRAAAVVAGALMISFGAAVLLRARGVRLGCMRLPGWLQRIFQRGLAFAAERPAAQRSLLVGLLTAFLPCGWLYAFVITAAGTGSASRGALVMAVFWAGTVPVLLLLGLGLQRMAAPIRRHVPTLTALLLVVVGAVTVLGRLSLPAYAAAADDAWSAVGDLQEQTSRVRTLGDEGPACCDHD
jgi:sulfite exporter TauE/SafE